MDTHAHKSINIFHKTHTHTYTQTIICVRYIYKKKKKNKKKNQYSQEKIINVLYIQSVSQYSTTTYLSFNYVTSLIIIFKFFDFFFFALKNDQD